MHDEPRILVLDIETKLLDIRSFGIRDQHIAIHQLRDIAKSARTVHCIGWKWLGARRASVLSEWEHGYDGMIEGSRDLLDQADAVLGFNHINFDMKKMNGQFALLGLDYPKPPTNIDIYRTVRQMGFPSSKLDYIAQAFGIGRKVEHPGYKMWNDCLEGCSVAQKKMARYCAGDVRLTEEVYLRLRRYIENHPNLAKDRGRCHKCGSPRLTKQGSKNTVKFNIISLKCGDCGGWQQGARSALKVANGAEHV